MSVFDPTTEIVRNRTTHNTIIVSTFSAGIYPPSAVTASRDVYSYINCTREIRKILARGRTTAGVPHSAEYGFGAWSQFDGRDVDGSRAASFS